MYENFSDTTSLVIYDISSKVTELRRDREEKRKRERESLEFLERVSEWYYRVPSGLDV